MLREIELFELYGHLLAYEASSPRALKVVVPDLPEEHYTSLVEWWTQEEQSFIYIADLYVSPDLRRRGLGREFLEKFLATYPGVVVLVAGSQDTPLDLDLVAFYEDYGFEVLAELEFPLMIKEIKLHPFPFISYE